MLFQFCLLLSCKLFSNERPAVMTKKVPHAKDDCYSVSWERLLNWKGSVDSHVVDFPYQEQSAKVARASVWEAS